MVISSRIGSLIPREYACWRRPLAENSLAEVDVTETRWRTTTFSSRPGSRAIESLKAAENSRSHWPRRRTWFCVRGTPRSTAVHMADFFDLVR
jgi:hypothetical protein